MLTCVQMGLVGATNLQHLLFQTSKVRWISVLVAPTSPCWTHISTYKSAMPACYKIIVGATWHSQHQLLLAENTITFCFCDGALLVVSSLTDKKTPITTPPYQVPSVDVTPDLPIFSLVTTFKVKKNKNKILISYFWTSFTFLQKLIFFENDF